MSVYSLRKVPLADIACSIYKWGYLQHIAERVAERERIDARESHGIFHDAWSSNVIVIYKPKQWSACFGVCFGVLRDPAKQVGINVTWIG